MTEAEALEKIPEHLRNEVPPGYAEEYYREMMYQTMKNIDYWLSVRGQREIRKMRKDLERNK